MKNHGSSPILGYAFRLFLVLVERVEIPQRGDAMTQRREDLRR